MNARGPKFVFITGGVVSALGKGLTAHHTVFLQLLELGAIRTG